jgi:exonuclease III
LPSALATKWLSVDVEGVPISLAGVHLADDSRPVAKSSGWHHLLDYARRNRDRPCAIIGDFNTGRHRQDEAGSTFGATDLLGCLWTLGYRDAWRHLHPEDREFTWFSHAGSGFRIDHAFLSPALLGRLRAARYSHAERELGVSDHSALLVDLA